MQSVLLRWPAVEQATQISRSTAWRLERLGRFPQRRRISANTVCWLSAEIEAWVAGLAAQSSVGLPSIPVATYGAKKSPVIPAHPSEGTTRRAGRPERSDRAEVKVFPDLPKSAINRQPTTGGNR